MKQAWTTQRSWEEKPGERTTAEREWGHVVSGPGDPWASRAFAGSKRRKLRYERVVARPPADRLSNEKEPIERGTPNGDRPTEADQGRRWCAP